MKKFSMKTTSIIIALVLALSVLSGCGASSDKGETGTAATTAAGTTVKATESKAEPSKLDTSKTVELKIFAIADAPRNQKLADTYFVELNKKLMEKLNCTVKFTYASGNDYQNNYQLVMASGEKYDLIHSGSWLNYTTNAIKGAFMPLDKLIPVYCPDVNTMVDQARWNGVKVKGQIFGIPTLKKSYVEPSFMYREDLRLKYKTPEITSLDSIEAYLQAIKDNEPSLLPSDDYQSQVYGTSFIYTTKYQIVDSSNDRHSNFVMDPKNPRKVLSTIETPEYKEYMKLMKKWADKGFWPKSVLSNIEWGVFSVMNGKAAASFNAQMLNYAWHAVQLEKDHPDWKIGYFLYSDLNPDSVVTGQNATSNMASVTRTAENPERALMLVNLIQTDEELWNFVTYGTEGVNFKLTDGKIDTSDIDTTVDGFNYFPASLFDNAKFFKPNFDQWPRYGEYESKLKARTRDNMLAGYVFDVSAIEAEYTAVNQVRIEYGFPLQAGLVNDVDKAYGDFVKRSKDVGLEKCRAEVERQLNEFFDATGQDKQ